MGNATIASYYRSQAVASQVGNREATKLCYNGSAYWSMFNIAQGFSLKQFLPLIGISLCLGVLILLGIYISKQKSFQPQLDKRLPIPITSPSLIPTPTLAAGQKAIYTFYIQATSYKASNEELTLNMSDTGKIHTVDMGTLIIVNFGRVGKFRVSASSPQAIFTNSGRPETINLPNNALGAFRVYRSGFGTIKVIETE